MFVDSEKCEYFEGILMKGRELQVSISLEQAQLSPVVSKTYDAAGGEETYLLVLHVGRSVFLSVCVSFSVCLSVSLTIES